MLCATFALGALSAALLPTSSRAVRTFTVYNGCPFTVWPALYTDLSAGTATPGYPTGWQANAYTSVSFSVPDNWKAGRIWARRECDFTTQNNVNSCLSGGCNGGLLCDPTTGTGVPPASIAEWTLSGDGNRDFYDVSVVDGFNIPMRIDNDARCPVADCPVDLAPACPAALKGPVDATGYALGCKSACEVDSAPTNSPNCCSGAYNTAATCPIANVQYYWYFKGNCPNAYAYAYDESSGTALWTCDASLNANYTLTFCPSGTSASNAPSPSPSPTLSLSPSSPPSSSSPPSPSSPTPPAASTTSPTIIGSTVPSASNQQGTSSGAPPSTTSTSSTSSSSSTTTFPIIPVGGGACSSRRPPASTWMYGVFVALLWTTDLS